MPRTYSYNAFESLLTDDLLAAGNLITLADDLSVWDARMPAYLVIEPTNPSKREYILVDSVNLGTKQFTIASRGLGGGNTASDHFVADNASVRAIFTHQNLDDIWIDLDAVKTGVADNTQALVDHASSTTDPHAPALYVLASGTRAFVNDQSMGSNRLTDLPDQTATGTPPVGREAINFDYLAEVLGGVDLGGYIKADGTVAMVNPLDLIAPPPTEDQHAANKAYVDAHTSPSDLTPALLRDGSQPPTAPTPWAGYKITGLGVGAATGEALRWDEFNVLDVAYTAHAANGSAHHAPYDDSGLQTKVNTKYSLSTDAGATAGRRIFISGVDPGPMVDGDLWFVPV